MVRIPPGALMFVFCESCMLSDQPDQSFRQILPSVECLRVIAKTVQGRSLPGIASKRHRGGGGGDFSIFITHIANKSQKERK
jgi:hypothetical protein